VIACIWKGAVRKHEGDAYAAYMQSTGLTAYAETSGNRGVWMLRRDIRRARSLVRRTARAQWRTVWPTSSLPKPDRGHGAGTRRRRKQRVSQNAGKATADRIDLPAFHA